MRKALRYHRLVDSVIEPMKREIFIEKNRYIVATADDYRRNGGFSGHLLYEHGQNLRAIFEKYYSRVIKIMSREIRASVKQEAKFSSWDRMLKKYIDRYAADRAKETAITTQADIKRAIQESFASGDPEETVIRDILTTRGISAYRADTIARTEMASAAMYASTNTALDIQSETQTQLKKYWVPVGDDRTRPAHADMMGSDGIDMNGYFEVGGERMFAPMDESASPEMVINCRCQLTYEMA